MSRFPNINKVVEDFAKDTVRLSRRNLNLNGFAGKKSNRKTNSSGRLSKGLGYKIQDTNSGVISTFTSKQDYARFVEEGRKKGSMPPVDALKKWIRQKKIRLSKTVTNKAGQKINKFVNKNERSIQQAAYAMAKKIKKDGIKPTPFFGEALEESRKALQPKAEEAIVKDVEDILFEDFQKQGYKVTK